MKVSHTLEPVFSSHSKTLILGSMPSTTSRELNKYYGNKYNRFWPVLESIYDEEITDWKDFIIEHDLALWDVIASCDIDASSDASIKNVVTNDIAKLVNMTEIENIFVLGTKAYTLYNRYLKDEVGIEAILLPSTSPANAKVSISDLVKKYRLIRDITEN